MPTISSRLSIPLLLIIFVALLAPFTARASDVSTGCKLRALFGFGCPPAPAPTPAPPAAPATVSAQAPSTATAPASVPAKAVPPSYGYDGSDTANYNYRTEAYVERITYCSSSYPNNPDRFDDCMNSPALNNLVARPVAESISDTKVIPADNAVANSVSQRATQYCYDNEYAVNAVYGGSYSKCQTDMERKFGGAGAASAAPQPVQVGGPTGNDSGPGQVGEYRFEQIAKNCREGDTGDDMNSCMLNSLKTYQGTVTASDAVRVQDYLQSQESSARTPAVGSAPAYVSPYNDARDPSGFQTYIDNCDRKYGSGTSYSNECKEPILREMGISGSAQDQTPADYYGQYAPVEDYSRPAPATDIARSQPCVSRAGNGDCLDEPTGGLRCYSWIASWLPACENYKSTPTLVSDDRGSVTTSYKPQQLPAPVEERQASLPRPYTREEEDALRRITITAEDTSFTSSETSSGEFVTPGWVTSFKNWFTGGNTEPEQQYRSYVDRDTEYQTLGDGSTVSISTLGDEEYYYDDTEPLSYEPPAPAQYGTFVGPDSYCANEDCSVLINYTDEQPGSYGYEGFPPAGVVTIPPQFGTDLTNEQVNLVGNRCLDIGFDLGSPSGRDCLEMEADNLREFGTLIPLDDLPGAHTGVDSSGESFIKEANFVLPEDNFNAPVNDNGWSLWEPTSWPIWGTETQAKPTRQFSTAVPFSGELFNQSLAAGAFGAFLLKDKQKDAPARPAREPFGNGL